MTEPPQLESDTPLRPVSAENVKRACRLIQEARALIPLDQAPTIGVDFRMVEQQCEPAADAQSTFFRAILLLALLEQGLLDTWRDGNELTDRVFQAAASFPLDHGVQGFDPERFIESVRSEP